MATSIENVKDSMIICLTLLEQETSNNSSYLLSVETILKLMRNAHLNPTEAKYRNVKTENKAFNAKVWQFAGAQQFLQASGWTEVDESVVLLDDTHIESAIEVLREVVRSHQSNPIPKQTMTQNTSYNQREMSQKEIQIAEDRKRQMESVKKEKEERKRISAQIRADRDETKERKSKDSKARALQFGAGVTKFKDIGIDIDKQGG